MEPLTEQLEKDFSMDHDPWLNSIRKRAFERFKKLAYPTTEQEEWRYTDITPLLRVPFQRPRKKENRLSRSKLEKHLTFTGVDSTSLVFINGDYSEKLSSRGPLPPGVLIGNFLSILETDRKKMEEHLAQYADTEEDRFTAINTAFLKDGAFVYIPSGTVLKQPIHLVYYSHANQNPNVTHPRTLLVAERNSQVHVIETYVGDGRYWTNAVTEVALGPNSRIDQYKIQEESEESFHLGLLQIHQGRDSHFTSHSISFGGAWARNNVRSALHEEGSAVTLNGLYMAVGKQHIDNQTAIDHVKPHAVSDELYKGILSGKANAVFNGKIIVRPNAQKTRARQFNKNLLLSDDVKVNTKPLLEIYANDVQCNHGATIGRLDENQLFYLRSRAIGEVDARNLLTYAFASEMIKRIGYGPLETYLEILLLQRLAHAHEKGVRG